MSDETNPVRLPTLAEVRASRTSLRDARSDAAPSDDAGIPTVRYTYEEAV